MCMLLCHFKLFQVSFKHSHLNSFHEHRRRDTFCELLIFSFLFLVCICNFENPCLLFINFCSFSYNINNNSLFKFGYTTKIDLFLVYIVCVFTAQKNNKECCHATENVCYVLYKSSDRI